ncbi:MAG: hypothetical protein ACAH83_10260 [Alphaproteobacteria bacterium]
MSEAEQKDWRAMLADVKADVAKYDAEAAAEAKRADAWVLRLHDVFNSKAANRFLPRMTPKSQRDFRDVAAKGLELTREIIEKILQKELSAQELSMIAAHARDLAPVDSTMFGMLQPVAYAAYNACEIAIEEERPHRDAQDKDIAEKELAVFRRYLAEQPQVVPVLSAMMLPGGGIPALGTISEKLGYPVGPKELEGLAAQVNGILDRSHPMPVVESFRTVKPGFPGLPVAGIPYDECDFYFGLSGSREVRDAVRAAAQAQKTPAAPLPKPGT